ncbi:MAG TPA: VOC family protein [Burkholderiales bacterium]|nr:VOC family protein [Burkholderiales bacterium]
MRSVELAIADVTAASAFLEGVWGLLPAGTSGTTRFWRGSGEHPYILSLTEARTPAVTAITFSGDDIDRLGKPDRDFDVPGGGKGFEIAGPEGQRYRFILETSRPATLPDRDRPMQLTHAVLNSPDVEGCERYAVEKLGFKVSDRTGHMRFVRCNRKHHALAYAKSDFPSLNHIAFEMRDMDAVMRGIGRLRDAGFDCVWGPGRHGPGNNVFGYFVAPWGGIVEYTAEVSEVGDDYKVGSPDDWKWPPGRIDHWGVSKKDVARTSAAEKVLRFRA